MTKHRITALTGSRAEFGIQRPLLLMLNESKEAQFQLIVTGSHTEEGTLKEIEDSEILVKEHVSCYASEDTKLATARAISEGIKNFGEVFSRNRPDILLLFGDRYEVFAAATAAYCLQIPIAHLCGGEVSGGSIDEGFRHCITKMASLHFTTADEHRERVIGMGEHPKNVFNTGELGLEHLSRSSLLSRQELAQDLGFNLEDDFFLFTFHPETQSAETSIDEVLSSMEGLRIIFTGANSDAGGGEINNKISSFVSKHPENTIFIHSLGRKRYLSLLKLARAVVGNSSSALIEAPSLRTPSINIGSRQRGRLAPPSTINCEGEAGAISKAIRNLDSISDFTNPFERENSVETVYRKLVSVELTKIQSKFFYDGN